MLRADFPNAKKTLVVLAIAAALTACGGGSQQAQAPATPQMAMQAIQAKAARLRAEQVPIADAATQLMDFAEETFPNLFPPGPTNATAEIFLYRYYPSTGNYLGVSTMNVGPFVESNVYIVGSSFGNTLANPIDMGPLTTYITPTGGGGGGGTGNGCFDLGLAETQGTQLVINYQYTGSINGTVTQTTTVGGMTTFEGQAARATTIVTSGGVGGAAVLNANGTSYSVRSGDAAMTHYGSQFTSSVVAGPVTTNTTIKSVYSPPYVDTLSGLTQGGSVTLTQMGTAFTTISFVSSFPLPDQNSQSAINTSTTHTYVGRESVSVGAGTFNACKYTAEAGGNTTTTWYVVGKGVPVKITSPGLTIQATSATINGAAVQ